MGSLEKEVGEVGVNSIMESIEKEVEENHMKAIQCKSTEEEEDKWLWGGSQVKEAEEEVETNTKTTMREDHLTTMKDKPCKSTGEADRWLTVDFLMIKVATEKKIGKCTTTNTKRSFKLGGTTNQCHKVDF